MKRSYLAFDLGAESGRAVLADFESGALRTQDVHRFANEPVEYHGGLHWDVQRLWHEMLRALGKLESHQRLDSIGLDTWGVDFALLGEQGTLLENPFHYRDTRTTGAMEEVLRIVPKEEVYEATGIQFMQINTLYQLFAAKHRTPRLLESATALVTVPDLFNFWLTGKVVCEFTNATTTQLVDPRVRDWARSLFERLGLPSALPAPIAEPGTILGTIRDEVVRGTSLAGTPIVLPACHDTGSAVAAIRTDEHTAYLSSGTWSLLGVELAAPLINEQAREQNFTNEGGVCGTVRFLKNVMGLWMLQGCRHCWTAAGRSYGYEELTAGAEEAKPFQYWVDPDDPSFLRPRNMVDAIDRFCERTGQGKPSHPGEYARLILESLALRYRSVLRSIETLTGRRLDQVRVIGGGSANRLLNQFTADCTGKRVIAGPVEATALGNIAMQMLATGAVASLGEAREVIERSFPTTVYEPRESAKWKDTGDNGPNLISAKAGNMEKLIERRSLLGGSLLAGTSLAWSLGVGSKPLEADSNPATVDTHSGKVRGSERGGVWSFVGIPYGGPTGGSNRFLAPVAPRPWAGVRDAIEAPPRCIQSPGSVFDLPIGDYFAGGRKEKLHLDQQKDSEDCLYLNVLTPGVGTSRKRPVMVYIHGGGFSSGSGIIILGADGLAREQDVVLVSVNHRLNVFGYLYLGGGGDSRFADSGNAGLLDLVMALRWVRDNIGQFGGDAENVTIFGESGGGAKISALMAMPSAKGLFQKAIVESGSALGVTSREEATETAKIVLSALGFKESQAGELQKISAERLFGAVRGEGERNPMRRLGPVLDGRSIPKQTWTPEAPGISGKVPMIIGSCKDEATLFMGGKDGENFRLDAAGLRSHLGSYLKLPEAEVNQLIATYEKERRGASPSDIFFAIASDQMFRMNAVTQAERKVKQGEAPVYMYWFTYDTTMEGGKYKAFHTAELPLVLRMVKYPETEQLSRRLSGAWAAFARSGSPNGSGLPEWPRYSLSKRETMTFGLGSRVENDPGREERVALQRLHPRGSAL